MRSKQNVRHQRNTDFDYIVL